MEEDTEGEELERRTVFVSNLPADFKQRELVRLMKQFGEVESVRFRSGMRTDHRLSKKLAIIKRQVVGRLNGYVRFANEDSVSGALSLNTTLVNGRRIFVDSSSREQKRYDKKRSVFVGNLPFDVTEDELYNHFCDCGCVTFVRVVRDQDYQLGKGFGYVVFKTGDAVALALKLNGSKLRHRQLRVSRVVDNPKENRKRAEASGPQTTVSGQKRLGKKKGRKKVKKPKTMAKKKYKTLMN